MSDIKLKPYVCENGRVYILPSNHCVFCRHCTDIFYDYTNGPYMFMCDLGKQHNTCDGSFEDDGYVFDEEDYAKRMMEQMDAIGKYLKEKESEDERGNGKI